VYDRYLRIKSLEKKFDSFQCKVLNETSYQIPVDTLEFSKGLGSDLYNLQLYSKLLGVRGHKFESVRIEKPSSYRRTEIRPFLVGIYNYFISRVIDYVSKLGFRPLVVYNTGFSKKDEMRLGIVARFKVLPLISIEGYYHGTAKVDPNRISLGNFDFGSEEFEMTVAQIMRDEIPMAFVEHFTKYQNDSYRYFPRNVEAVCSAMSWHFDEVFKQACVRFRSNGSRLLGIQHGGNYGMQLGLAGEAHEHKILNTLYVWGTAENHQKSTCRIKSMPAPKLIPRSKEYSHKLKLSKNRILWCGTSVRRYLSSGLSIPEWHERYLDCQKDFLQNLSSNARQHLVFRPHVEDEGWDAVARLRRVFPNLVVEKWNKVFTDSLVSSTLYVGDHLSTTFLESIFHNIPTVIFWDPKTCCVTRGARMHFDKFQQVGIFHTTPGSAARHINENFTRIADWWADEQVQEAVTEFSRDYARRHNDIINLWAQELTALN
jgi:putative transferase (TIGR04331 family)